MHAISIGKDDGKMSLINKLFKISATKCHKNSTVLIRFTVQPQFPHK